MAYFIEEMMKLWLYAAGLGLCLIALIGIVNYIAMKRVEKLNRSWDEAARKTIKRSNRRKDVSDPDDEE